MASTDQLGEAAGVAHPLNEHIGFVRWKSTYAVGVTDSLISRGRAMCSWMNIQVSQVTSMITLWTDRIIQATPGCSWMTIQGFTAESSQSELTLSIVLMILAGAGRYMVQKCNGFMMSWCYGPRMFLDHMVWQVAFLITFHTKVCFMSLTLQLICCIGKPSNAAS